MISTILKDHSVFISWRTEDDLKAGVFTIWKYLNHGASQFNKANITHNVVFIPQIWMKPHTLISTELSPRIVNLLNNLILAKIKYHVIWGSYKIAPVITYLISIRSLTRLLKVSARPTNLLNILCNEKKNQMIKMKINKFIYDSRS